VAPDSSRIRCLDGLRGSAAVVVLLNHSMLLSATLAGAFITYTDNRGAIPWVLTYTPLHLWWAGREAVIVFFVLSGYVLARSAYGRTFTWLAYYPSRLIRLYLPVVAAVLWSSDMTSGDRGG
jgi:peptidoglycan/LPS O-acetylase OafA/YrhL